MPPKKKTGRAAVQAADSLATLVRKSTQLPRPSSHYADASPSTARNESPVGTGDDPTTTLVVTDARYLTISEALQR